MLLTLDCTEGGERDVMSVNPLPRAALSRNWEKPTRLAHGIVPTVWLRPRSSACGAPRLR